ncbi:hypothetical protein [Sphingobium baderi]|uniref:hypothetical protein n=1 Tax=Sphingobium baderi TaxID=1332080 RepID=UPI000A704BBD|nr:hypothetical protein [Sphingobium baderi]
MSKSANVPSFLALSCVSALALASTAHAQDDAQASKLGGVTVTDTALDEPGVKVDQRPRFGRTGCSDRSSHN